MQEKNKRTTESKGVSNGFFGEHYYVFRKQYFHIKIEKYWLAARWWKKATLDEKFHTKNHLLNIHTLRLLPFQQIFI